MGKTIKTGGPLIIKTVQPTEPVQVENKPAEAPQQKKPAPGPDQEQVGLAPVQSETVQGMAARQGEAPKPGGGVLGFMKQQKAQAPDGKQAWFAGDWNMASRKAEGDPRQNLWAEGGPLDKLDRVLRGMGEEGKARAHEAQAPGYLVPGQSGSEGGRGVAGTEHLHESYYTDFEQGKRALYEAAFGDADVTVMPSVSGFDFMNSGGGIQSLPRGGRVAVLLDGEPLEFKKEKIGDSTYVDLMKDGKKISYDQARQAHFAYLDANDRPVGDGALTGKLDASWWGSGDGAAQAGLYLEQPQKPVMVPGKDKEGNDVNVLFSPHDIEGLLAMVGREMKMGQLDMEGRRYELGRDVIQLKDGRTLQGEVMLDSRAFPRVKDLVKGSADDYRTITPEDLAKQGRDQVSFERGDGTFEKIPVADIKSLAVRTGEDVRPWVMRDKVMQYAAQGGGMADVDNLHKVMPRPFKSAQSTVFEQRPDWAQGDKREEQLDPSLRREFGEMTIEFGDQPRTYRYWAAYDDKGKPVDGGWYTGQGAERPPDFLFAPKDPGKIVWPDKLESNPWVDVALVKYLYQQSIE